jgi:hypothetical protein
MSKPNAEQLRHIEGLMEGVRAAFPTADQEFARELLTQAVVHNDGFWRQVLGVFSSERRERATKEAVLAPGLLFAADALDGWMRNTRGES